MADNLLVSSRIAGRLKAAGWTVEIESRPDRVCGHAAGRPRAILLDLTVRDLDFPDFFRSLASDPSLRMVPVVGFCGHLDRPRREAALAAGCASVVPNSAAAEDPAGLLERLLSSH